jgi:hypothetical protein
MTLSYVRIKMLLHTGPNDVSEAGIALNFR